MQDSRFVKTGEDMEPGSEIFEHVRIVYVLWALVFSLIAGYIWSVASVQFIGPSTRLVGIRSLFEPRFVGNWRYFKNAGEVIDEGYSQLTPFKIARNDADLVVLPYSAVEEVKALPREIANPTIAHAHNLLGRYTKMDLILHSDLHFRMIQTKLTPSLGSLTRPMEDEVKWAFRCMPDCSQKWTAIKPYHTVLKLVASTSARIFVGLPLCRDPRWLEASVQFTENIFITVVSMRILPSWTHDLLSWLLPSNYRSARYIREAQKLFVPEIKRRQALLAAGKLDAASSDTLLSWMIECAQGADRDPHHLAHLEIVISLAAIHTSQMNVVHVLYDLAARPEYIEELRDEIRSVVNAKGGSWDKTSYTQLRKMDSFMKESQRFNPPSVLSFHRVMMSAYDMKDGTHLPRGAHIAMPVQAIQHDPAITERPDVFDGLRYYKLREATGETHRHQFAMTEKTQLHFGHGRAACPGRFFASLEIKCILVHFIMNYDFKLAKDQRPANLRAHEFIFPNPGGEIMVKLRDKPESPL